MNFSLINMTEYIVSRTGFNGKIAIVLGSGLGEFAAKLTNPIVVPYNAIPHYPVPTVVGHSGEFIIGDYKNIPILAAKGRFHYYEGHPLEVVTLPIRLFNALGIKYVIITNAAGSVKKVLKPGSLMLINGYIDCTFLLNSKLPKPIFNVSERLIKSVEQAAQLAGVKIHKGLYCWTQGPSYETPAEVDFINNLGADAVGMSTVPELQTAHKLGIKAVGVSTITNYAAGITSQPLTHNEVIETADRTKHTFAKLIGATILEIGKLK